MCDVIIWSQESVHEDEIEKKEVGKDKTDRNKVRVCLRYGEKRQGLHNGASPEKSKNQWIIHQDRSVSNLYNQDMNKSSKEVSLHKDARIVLIIGSMKTKADSDDANSTVNISPVDSNRDSIMETARIRSKMSKDGAHDRHADKSECLEETF